MRHARIINTGAIVILFFYLVLPFPLWAAETRDQLIAAAKKESELYFVAGPGTFGGKKGLAEIEAAFNKKFGLNSRILFTAGPEMNSMAARVISEYKAGGKASTDIYLGSLGQFAHLQKESVLEEANLSAIFPWVTKNMEEILAGKAVLVYTSPRGIIYNSSLIASDKAPKKYQDLIDPRLNPPWAGKLAIPPYPNWLVELSLMWGEERVKDFTRKLVALGGGWLRYGEEERVVSGEFPIMANIGDSLATMWKWQAKGAPLIAVWARARTTRPIFIWACRKIPRIRIWRNCLPHSWFPRKVSQFSINMISAPLHWLKARGWRSMFGKMALCCRIPKRFSTFT